MVCVRKPSTDEIIATSANQIVPLKFVDLQKCCTIFPRPPFPLAVLKGGLGTRLEVLITKHLLRMFVSSIYMYEACM